MPGIVYPPALPVLTIGGRVFTDLQNLIILIGGFNAGANGNSTLRKVNGGTGAYTPSGSKSFRALAFRAHVSVVGAAGTGVFFLYSDNDAGVQSNTAFTNPMYHGSGYQYSGNDFQVAALTGLAPAEGPLNMLVPNGKYPGCSNGASASVGRVYVFGYEE